MKRGEGPVLISGFLACALSQDSPVRTGPARSLCASAWAFPHPNRQPVRLSGHVPVGALSPCGQPAVWVKRLAALGRPARYVALLLCDVFLSILAIGRCHN